MNVNAISLVGKSPVYATPAQTALHNDNSPAKHCPFAANAEIPIKLIKLYDHEYQIVEEIIELTCRSLTPTWSTL